MELSTGNVEIEKKKNFSDKIFLFLVRTEWKFEAVLK